MKQGLWDLEKHLGYKRRLSGRTLKLRGFAADRHEGSVGPTCSSRSQNRERRTGMRDLDSIRRFEYRHPRMTTGFNVDFAAGAETLHGLCRDVSEDGIRAEFDGSVVVGSSGLLVLRHPIGVLKLEARVAYVERRQVGLVFLFQTPWERRVTIEFVASIANHKGTSLAVRFP